MFKNRWSFGSYLIFRYFVLDVPKDEAFGVLLFSRINSEICDKNFPKYPCASSDCVKL